MKNKSKIEYPYLLIFHEHHADRYFYIGNEDDYKEAFFKLFKEREISEFINYYATAEDLKLEIDSLEKQIQSEQNAVDDMQLLTAAENDYDIKNLIASKKNNIHNMKIQLKRILEKSDILNKIRKENKPSDELVYLMKSIYKEDVSKEYFDNLGAKEEE